MTTRRLDVFGVSVREKMDNEIKSVKMEKEQEQLAKRKKTISFQPKDLQRLTLDRKVLKSYKRSDNIEKVLVPSTFNFDRDKQPSSQRSNRSHRSRRSSEDYTNRDNRVLNLYSPTIKLLSEDDKVLLIRKT